jgi:ATP-dependent DNA ligase
MPRLSSKPKHDVPDNIEDWRPQRYGRSVRSVRDAIIEPSWGGVRVLARVDYGRTLFFDEDGVDCSEEFTELGGELSSAVLGEGLILDGFLTIEPTQSGVGALAAEAEAPGGGQIIAQMFMGSRANRKPGPARRLDTDKPIAFVAVDLLRIDDSLLVDLPLLERKRILDGALRVGERIRVTPYVRPPLGSYAATWRGLGFAEVVYKSANSRYYPAGQNDDWATAEILVR